LELLIGAGPDREKRLAFDGTPPDWRKLVTLDMSDAHGCDVVHDLNVLPLPFSADLFDEIHAYDVLEHVGRQGDWKFFFAQFSDFWRILKPDGLIVGTSPLPYSPWAWGDPGHTRIISPESLHFLDQTHYGVPPMTDYRPWYAADFELLHSEASANGQHSFVLRAVKPSRG